MTEHRMRRLLRHLFLLALLCFAPLALWGEGKAYTPELVPKVFATDSTRLFSDPEGYVSPEGRERIDAALYELRRRNGVEFATVILPSIGERDIESFSTDLFRLWGIGSKTRNDGLLLLIVMDQRKVRFETGYGLEGILPDVLASRIQRQEILPRMRQGDYEGAIYNGVIGRHKGQKNSRPAFFSSSTHSRYLQQAIVLFPAYAKRSYALGMPPKRREPDCLR